MMKTIAIACVLAAALMGTAAADYLVVPVEKVIDGGLAAFIVRTVDTAESEGWEGIVFRVDTPGGRVDSAVEIKDTILKARVTTVAFVDKNAISAGSLISLACDSLYMSTGASIGAATAVDLQGNKASEKMISYFRAQMRATAEATNRRADLAEAMVDEDIEIEGVSEKGKLLTLTYREAENLGISDGTVESIGDVLERLGAAGASYEIMRPNWAENLVRFLTHPIVSSLLMSVGFLGLMFEIRTPGWGIGGTIALIALGFFFGSHYIVRLADVGELLLFAAGIALLTAEIFLLPGFGIAGAAGIVLIIASLYLSLIGKLPLTVDYLRALYSLSGAFAATVAGTLILIRFLPRTTMFRKLTLETVESAQAGFSSSDSADTLAGLHGTALSDLRPSGRAEIDGRRWHVVTEGEYVDKGSEIVVLEARGSKVVVRKV